MIQYSPWTRWVFTGDATIGKTAHASDDSPPVLNHAALGSAPIIKLRLEADYEATTALHLFAGYEYTYFTFGQSDVQSSGFLEPNSETKLSEFSAGMRISF
jgi:hypothetical protein